MAVGLTKTGAWYAWACSRVLSDEGALASLPLVVLVLGAGAMWALRHRPTRLLWPLMTVSAALSWLAALAISGKQGGAISLSVWQPASIFSSGVILQLDQIGWTNIYAAATVILSISLTAPSRDGGVAGLGKAMMLFYAALAMAAMMAGNLLTVALTWALLDLAGFVMVLQLSTDAQVLQSSLRRLGAGGLSVVMVLAAASLAWRSGSDNLISSPQSAATTAVLLGLAGLLRLGSVPLHFSLPGFPQARRGVGAMLGLLPPAAVLAVLARQSLPALADSARIWFGVAGALGVVIGAGRWILEPDPVRGRPYLGLGICGWGVLVASTRPDLASAALLASGILLLMTGSISSLVMVQTPAHRFWTLAGGALLIGLPWTPASGLFGPMLHGLRGLLDVGVVVLEMAGAAALAAGFVRVALSPIESGRASETLSRILYGAGLALPVIASLGLGIQMQQTIALAEGFIALGTLGLATIIWQAVTRLPPAGRISGRRLARWLDLEPLSRLAGIFYGLGLRALQSLGRLLDGEGGMLWLMVILIMVFIGIRGAG
jgi:hypothetical protein